MSGSLPPFCLQPHLNHKFQIRNINSPLRSCMILSSIHFCNPVHYNCVACISDLEHIQIKHTSVLNKHLQFQQSLPALIPHDAGLTLATHIFTLPDAYKKCNSHLMPSKSTHWKFQLMRKLLFLMGIQQLRFQSLSWKLYYLTMIIEPFTSEAIPLF